MNRCVLLSTPYILNTFVLFLKASAQRDSVQRFFLTRLYFVFVLMLIPAMGMQLVDSFEFQRVELLVVHVSEWCAVCVFGVSPSDDHTISGINGPVDDLSQLSL